MQNLPCFFVRIKLQTLSHAESDSSAWLSVFAPDFNESKAVVEAQLAEVILEQIVLSCRLHLSSVKINGAVVCCIKICGGRTEGKERDLPCSSFSPWHAVLMWKHVKYGCVSSWSCIHHPLHLARAHMGRRAGASGTLPVAHIKEYEGCIQAASNSFVLLFPPPSEICAALWARPSAEAKPRHYATISA